MGIAVREQSVPGNLSAIIDEEVRVVQYYVRAGKNKGTELVSPDVDAELEQLTVDPWCTPTGMLSAHLEDQILDLNGSVRPRIFWLMLASRFQVRSNFYSCLTVAQRNMLNGERNYRSPCGPVWSEPLNSERQPPRTGERTNSARCWRTG
jgi:hypothetical protein